MYVQTSDGTWLHYANASKRRAEAARRGWCNFAQTQHRRHHRAQILAPPPTCRRRRNRMAPRSTPARFRAAALNRSGTHPGNNAIISMILGAQKRTGMMFGAGKGDAPGGQLNDLQLQMNVGGDGLVKQVSVTFQGQDTGSSAVDGSLHVERHVQPAWRHAADYSAPSSTGCSARNPAARTQLYQNGHQTRRQT